MKHFYTRGLVMGLVILVATVSTTVAQRLETCSVFPPDNVWTHQHPAGR
jgi:hypothetical protein